MKVELRPQAARDLRTSLILREIANREGIAVTDEDLDAEIDDLVSGAPEAEEMRQAYVSNQYLRSALRNDLYDQRLTDRLIDIATEGKGAVTNGFVPEEVAGEESESSQNESLADKNAAPADPDEGDESSTSTSDSADEENGD